MRNSVYWDATSIAFLRACWVDGMSASKIAAQIPGATRSAVLGKLHRLALHGRPPKPSEKRSVAELPEGFGEVPRKSAPKPKPLPAPVELIDGVVVSRRVAIGDLSEPDCRWPLGDPRSRDFAYCGNARRLGSRYCPHHCGMAYIPVRPREERATPRPRLGGFRFDRDNQRAP